jgi:hypothetical protein
MHGGLARRIAAAHHKYVFAIDQRGLTRAGAVIKARAEKTLFTRQI